MVDVYQQQKNAYIQLMLPTPTPSPSPPPIPAPPAPLLPHKKSASQQLISAQSSSPPISSVSVSSSNVNCRTPKYSKKIENMNKICVEGVQNLFQKFPDADRHFGDFNYHFDFHFKCWAGNKLPVLRKCNVEFFGDQGDQDRTGRARRDISKKKFAKFYDKHRQQNDKYQTLKPKQPPHPQQKPSNTPTSIPSMQASPQNSHRCYLIRNLILTTPSTTQPESSKHQKSHKSSLHLMPNKLKQQQRRASKIIKINKMQPSTSVKQKKIDIQSPAELCTYRIPCEDLAKNVSKDEIGKSFGKKSVQVGKQVGRKIWDGVRVGVEKGSGGKKGENFMTGWNYQIQEIQEF